MLISTQKANLLLNPISLDSDTYFVEKKGNKNFIYYAKEKCKSVEYVFDCLVDDISLVIYEDLEQNKIYIIKAHIETDTFEFDIEAVNFNIKKIEDIVNLTIFKAGIKKIYFLDNSVLKDKITIRNSEIELLSHKKVNQEIKKAPTLRTKNKYAFINLVVFVLLLLLNNGFNIFSEKLDKEKTADFNTKYSLLEQKILLQEEDIAKYTEIKNKRLEVLYNFNELSSYSPNDRKGQR